ncbi:hypothetical protein, partial [Cereibacter sediminicola]|uniref:hypothetical protein n=1 Tax=Cereibacter sediminicola TaxID=2584941 RepID=UPI001C92DDB7
APVPVLDRDVELDLPPANFLRRMAGSDLGPDLVRPRWEKVATQAERGPEGSIPVEGAPFYGNSPLQATVQR